MGDKNSYLVQILGFSYYIVILAYNITIQTSSFKNGMSY